MTSHLYNKCHQNLLTVVTLCLPKMTKLTILGRFSIIYFRGLGLRIRVRGWVWVWVRVWVRVRIGVGVRVSVVLWSW